MSNRRLDLDIAGLVGVVVVGLVGGRRNVLVGLHDALDTCRSDHNRRRYAFVAKARAYGASSRQSGFRRHLSCLEIKALKFSVIHKTTQHAATTIFRLHCASLPKTIKCK